MGVDMERMEVDLQHLLKLQYEGQVQVFHLIRISGCALVEDQHLFYPGCPQPIWQGQGEREPASSPAQCKILWKVKAASLK